MPHFLACISRLDQFLFWAGQFPTFSVVSFTTILPEPVLRLLEPLWPEPIVKLFQFVLKSLYNGKFYEQCDGAAMASPLSSIVADVYMEAFEQSTLDVVTYKPLWYQCYVDDTLLIWPHGLEKLFVAFLNTQQQNNRFTLELEQAGQLPFLDILIIRNPNGTLDTQFIENTYQPLLKPTESSSLSSEVFYNDHLAR